MLAAALSLLIRLSGSAMASHSDMRKDADGDDKMSGTKKYTRNWPSTGMSSWTSMGFASIYLLVEV